MTKTLIVDVETNGLTDYTELWCAVSFCLETKELKVFDWKDKGHVEAFKDYIKDATHFIGHNFISFDRHVIERFTGITVDVERISDTLVRSRLFNSGRDGGHSLERWGAYLGVPKVGADYNEWERYDPIIVERCKRDVYITYKLWKHLAEEGKNVSRTAINLEERFQELADKISARGFPINRVLLEQKYTGLLGRRSDLDVEIQRAFPPRAIRIATIFPKTTKSGEISRSTKGLRAIEAETRGSDGLLLWGPYTLLEWQTFNVGSPQQVRERMDEFGWKPYIKTKTGKNYKVCQENLDTLPEDAPPEAQLIPEYMRVQTRIELIENWVASLGDRDRVHGRIIPIGAITHRCAHVDPNTANIPGNDDKQWKIRECWGFLPTEKKRCLVGVDAKSIQMRVLAHLLAAYTDDKSFMNACLHGDIHIDFTLPILRKAVPDAPLLQETPDHDVKWIKQNVTKRFNYAYVLGMGSEKAGTLLGVDKKKGKIAKSFFTDAFPGMRQLDADLERLAKIGWGPAPDGRFLPIRSHFLALSVYLQAIEAIVMKLAGLLYEKEARKRGLDAWLCAFVHDEYVIDCSNEDADEAGELMAECIKKSGEMLKLRCPMAGEYWREEEDENGKPCLKPAKGLTWKDVH